MNILKKATRVFSTSCLLIVCLAACGADSKKLTMSTSAIDFNAKHTLMESNVATELKSFGQVIEQSDIQAIYEALVVENNFTFKTKTDASSMNYIQMNADAPVYEKGNQNSAIITNVIKGTTLSYLKEQVTSNDGVVWYKVALENGTIGFVKREYATLIESLPVQTNESTSTIQGDFIEITANEANVRIEPNINASVLYEAKKGESFIFTGNAVHTADGRTWYEVAFGEYFSNGYISSVVAKVVEQQMSDERAQTSTFHVATPGANVRVTANIDSDVMFIVNNGEVLTYLGYSETSADGRTWYLVSNGTETGYISSNTGTIK